MANIKLPDSNHHTVGLWSQNIINNFVLITKVYLTSALVFPRHLPLPPLIADTSFLVYSQTPP